MQYFSESHWLAYTKPQFPTFKGRHFFSTAKLFRRGNYQHFIKNDNMTNKIITKFAKKGINLSPDAYFIIKNSKRPVDLSSNIIIKLKSGKYSDDDLISVDEKIVKEIMHDLGMDIAGANDIKREIARRDKLTLSIPWIGKITFRPSDVDVLHRMIAGEEIHNDNN